MFRKASSIKVPDILFRTIKTGCPSIDKTFSDTEGIVPSQVVFVSGKPGSGKTTICLVIGVKTQMATKKPAAFISLEMSDFQLKHSAKKIPGFENMMVDTDFDLHMTLDTLRTMKPSIVILDSIQKAAIMMVKHKTSPNENQAQKDIFNEFTKFAKETMIPVLLIGHMTKGGTYQGPSYLAHEGDALMLVEYDREIDIRQWFFEKNRFGGLTEQQPFGISSSEVWVGSSFAFDKLAPEDPKGNLQEDFNLAALRMRAVTEQFKEKCKDKAALGLGEIMACSREMIDFLKLLEREKMQKESFVGDSRRVKLTFKHKGVAHCVFRKGEIQIGDVMALPRFEIGKIGYKKEQPFIKRNCKDREDLFLWVICHEWVHLYKGMQKHTVLFFQTVEALWKKFQGAIQPQAIPTLRPILSDAAIEATTEE
jgi:RecA/RadA recombinase